METEKPTHVSVLHVKGPCYTTRTFYGRNRIENEQLICPSAVLTLVLAFMEKTSSASLPDIRRINMLRMTRWERFKSLFWRG